MGLCISCSNDEINYNQNKKLNAEENNKMTESKTMSDTQNMSVMLESQTNNILPNEKNNEEEKNNKDDDIFIEDYGKNDTLEFSIVELFDEKSNNFLLNPLGMSTIANTRIYNKEFLLHDKKIFINPLTFSLNVEPN